MKYHHTRRIAVSPCAMEVLQTVARHAVTDARAPLVVDGEERQPSTPCCVIEVELRACRRATPLITWVKHSAITTTSRFVL